MTTYKHSKQENTTFHSLLSSFRLSNDLDPFKGHKRTICVTNCNPRETKFLGCRRELEKMTALITRTDSVAVSKRIPKNNKVEQAETSNTNGNYLENRQLSFMSDRGIRHGIVTKVWSSLKIMLGVQGSMQAPTEVNAPCRGPEANLLPFFFFFSLKYHFHWMWPTILTMKHFWLKAV